MKLRRTRKYILIGICLAALAIVLCLAAPHISSALADDGGTASYTKQVSNNAAGAETLAFQPDADYEPSEEVLYFSTFGMALIVFLAAMLVYVFLRFVISRNIVLFTRYRLAKNDDAEAVDINNMYAPAKPAKPTKPVKAPSIPKIKKENYVELLTIGCALALAGALLTTLTPMISAYYIEGHTRWLYLLMLLPAFLMFALFVPIVVNSYKLSKNAVIVYTVLAFVFAAACVVCYCVFIPEDILGVPAKVACSLFTFIIDFFAVTCVVPLDKSCKASVKAIKDGKITDAAESV